MAAAVKPAITAMHTNSMMYGAAKRGLFQQAQQQVVAGHRAHHRGQAADSGSLDHRLRVLRSLCHRIDDLVEALVSLPEHQCQHNTADKQGRPGGPVDQVEQKDHDTHGDQQEEGVGQSLSVQIHVVGVAFTGDKAFPFGDVLLSCPVEIPQVAAAPRWQSRR